MSSIGLQTANEKLSNRNPKTLGKFSDWDDKQQIPIVILVKKKEKKENGSSFNSHDVKSSVQYSFKKQSWYKIHVYYRMIVFVRMRVKVGIKSKCE